MGAINFKSDYFVITLLGIIFFIPFLGGVHLFDWDEINFAEAAREMIASGDYFHVQIDYQPFWEKPPLFIWMQVAAMKVFGINEFAARFPNAVCGIATLLLLFFIGKKIHGRTFGWIWVLCYLGSILPHLYFRSGIIDPWFNLLIFSSLYFLILQLSKQENFGQVKDVFQKNKFLIYGGVLLGLAVLTKGPVAILIVGLTGLVFLIREKFRMFFKIQEVIIYGFSALLVMLLWFGVEWIINGSWFIEEFVKYQIRLLQTEDAGHGGFFGYHFVVLLLGCFPASFFAVGSLWKSPLPLDAQKDFLKIDFRKWMVNMFWVVLILFSIVQSKIVHYSSLCYFPLTYLAATYISSYLKKEEKFSSLIKNSILIFGGIISLLFIAVPFVGKNINMVREKLSHDKFAWSNLEADVVWTYWDIIPGLILLTGVFGFYFFQQRKEVRKSIVTIFGGSAIFIAASLYFFINNIEGYSQNAVIEFYKNLEGKDVYVKNVGFKSYAPLFYFKKPANLRDENRNTNWLIKGKIDKDVYFVTKITNDQFFKDHPEVKLIDSKNGFVFFKREKEKK